MRRKKELRRRSKGLKLDFKIKGINYEEEKSMRKILVASNGIYPDEKSVSYTVDLATTLKSQVEFLEVVSENKKIIVSKKKKNFFGVIKSLIEDAYVAVSFAEENQQEIAKEIVNEAIMNLHPYISKLKENGIHTHLTIKKGEFLKETREFILKNRDILMAILAVKKDKNTALYLDVLKKEVDIPIILVRS